MVFYIYKLQEVHPVGTIFFLKNPEPNVIIFTFANKNLEKLKME